MKALKKVEEEILNYAPRKGILKKNKLKQRRNYEEKHRGHQTKKEE